MDVVSSRRRRRFCCGNYYCMPAPYINVPPFFPSRELLWRRCCSSSSHYYPSAVLSFGAFIIKLHTQTHVDFSYCSSGWCTKEAPGFTYITLGAPPHSLIMLSFLIWQIHIIINCLEHCTASHCHCHVIAGIFFVLPCIESYQIVDLRTITLDVPPQEVNTKPAAKWLLLFSSHPTNSNRRIDAGDRASRNSNRTYSTNRPRPPACPSNKKWYTKSMFVYTYMWYVNIQQQ